MVSFAPNTQSYLYNHMSFFTDYETDKNPLCCLNKNTIYDWLSCNVNMKKFKKLVDKANMRGTLNDEQANVTLFAVPDRFLNLTNNYIDSIDEGSAREIIFSLLILRQLGRDLITSSPVSYFYTKNPAMRMYITNINGITTVNECSKIIQFDNWCDNGIIHVLDNIFFPTDNHFLN
jgi:hypothetical protein